jgi:hypothetical protein
VGQRVGADEPAARKAKPIQCPPWPAEPHNHLVKHELAQIRAAAPAAAH